MKNINRIYQLEREKEPLKFWRYKRKSLKEFHTTDGDIENGIDRIP